MIVSGGIGNMIDRTLRTGEIFEGEKVVVDFIDFRLINFAVFNRFLFPGQMEGMIFSIFAIAIAAAETAIAIAIIINIYRHIRNIDADNLDDMKY